MTPPFATMDSASRHWIVYYFETSIVGTYHISSRSFYSIWKTSITLRHRFGAELLWAVLYSLETWCLFYAFTEIWPRFLLLKSERSSKLFSGLEKVSVGHVPLSVIDAFLAIPETSLAPWSWIMRLDSCNYLMRKEPGVDAENGRRGA